MGPDPFFKVQAPPGQTVVRRALSAKQMSAKRLSWHQAQTGRASTRAGTDDRISVHFSLIVKRGQIGVPRRVNTDFVDYLSRKGGRR